MVGKRVGSYCFTLLGYSTNRQQHLTLWTKSLQWPQLSEKLLLIGFGQNVLRIGRKKKTTRCVKSVRVLNFSGPYSVQMWENTDQKNSEYGHFSCNDRLFYQHLLRKLEILYSKCCIAKLKAQTVPSPHAPYCNFIFEFKLHISCNWACIKD